MTGDETAIGVEEMTGDETAIGTSGIDGGGGGGGAIYSGTVPNVIPDIFSVLSHSSLYFLMMYIMKKNTKSIPKNTNVLCILLDEKILMKEFIYYIISFYSGENLV